MKKPKLELQKLGDQAFVDFLTLVATEMGSTAGAAVFTAPDPALTVLSGHATTIKGLMNQRANLQQQARQLTLQIRNARNAAEPDVNKEAGYVSDTAQGDPAVIALAGMQVTDDVLSASGPMAKVENVHAAQGDADTEVDLNWDAVAGRTKNYRVEMTTDPAGLTGWAFKMNTGGKSKATVTGLTSGTRYWFRVIAEGPGGEGAASDPVTSVSGPSFNSSGLRTVGRVGQGADVAE
jgi:hypothetical protein